jgi:hypothetical protein
MILKLIKSADTPKVGDLVKNGDSLRVIKLGDNIYDLCQRKP